MALATLSDVAKHRKRLSFIVARGSWRMGVELEKGWKAIDQKGPQDLITWGLRHYSLARGLN